MKRGEKSIKILAPVTRRSDVTDVEGKPVLDADGGVIRRQSVVGFRPASVFDIEQTSGPPVSQPDRPTLLSGQAPAGLWEALAGEVAERGYRLLRGNRERLGTANGLTVASRREVWVCEDVDDAQAVKTLAHELAHVLLHADVSNEIEPCRGVIEVEAESVAYLTLAAHGMSTGSYSFPYVAHWAYPLAAVEHAPMAEIVARTGARVTETARTLIEITEPAVTKSAETASAALAARTAIAARATANLREDADAIAHPSIKREVLIGVVADSRNYFRGQVMDSWVPAYLAGRHLGSALTSHEIGYAPMGWTALTDHLRSLGYGDYHIEASGMAVKARTGNLIDRFRDRLTLPLRDETGSLVAFTGRVGPDAADDVPKYLNSPTTPIYQKGEVLYGCVTTREALAAGSRAVICEGPLDAVAVDIASSQAAGRMVGLASCGTAFTESHAHQLEKLVGAANVCLAFDGDGPGRGAAEKVWAAIAGRGHFDVSVAELPKGGDPASLGASNSVQLINVVDRARAAAFVLADQRLASCSLTDNPIRQVFAFRQLSEWTDRVMPDQRADFVLHLARSLDIDPAEAATEMGQRRPELFAEDLPGRVLVHCASLASELDEAQARTHVDSAGGGALSAPVNRIVIVS